VSTLADLVRARTDLRDADVDWLHRLVSEWQLLADLSFADLVLRVRTTEGGWLAVAHMRPTTGPTTWPEDVVGTEVPSAAVRQLERAAVAVGRSASVRRSGNPASRSGLTSSASAGATGCWPC
jgi:hypothetical protein